MMDKDQLEQILENHALYLKTGAGSKANLHHADMSDADLHDANLRGANLRCANLRCANLRDANLHGANLHGADMSGANLIHANLRGADLSDANLHGANLHGADMSDADLIHANLRGANLHGANLHGANINSPAFRLDTGFYSISFVAPFLQIGCEKYTVEEWRGFDDAKIKAMDRKALDFWHEHKEFLLLMCDTIGKRPHGKFQNETKHPS